MGEPAGIGGELALMAWQRRHQQAVPPFFVLDDPARLQRLAAALGWAVPVAAISAPAEAVELFERALPVLPLAQTVTAAPGRPEPANAAAVRASIEQAVALARSGAAAAVVTNPIHKGVLYQAGFPFPGHTEYLAALTGVAEADTVMMLAGAGLRVVPVTIHVSLKEAIARLSGSAIQRTIRVTHAALRDRFGLPRPRIAVAGLNPHAGEDGGMGREELELITPALDQLRAEGLDVTGPWPADTLFHAVARQTYDVAVCMYHDQALIPLKTLAFDSGVNLTLGLPIIRTSPDHGTAFALAGTGQATPHSLLAALNLAHQLSA